MPRICICLLGMLCLMPVVSCESKRNASEMADAEEIAAGVYGESMLTDAEKAWQREVRSAILEQTRRTRAAESEMEKAVEDAKEQLDAGRFESLEASQEVWLKSGRGALVNRLVGRGVPPAEAFAQSAQMRADWIRLRTAWALLIEMPGKFGGFFRADQGRTMEIYEMDGSLLNLVIRMEEKDFIFTASGDARDGVLTSEFDRDAAITVRPDDAAVYVELSGTFLKSRMADVGEVVEGRYSRVKPGEFDVFTP